MDLQIQKVPNTRKGMVPYSKPGKLGKSPRCIIISIHETIDAAGMIRIVSRSAESATKSKFINKLARIGRD